MKKDYDFKNINTERKNGIITHISSLWSPYGIGNFGKEAYEYADFLKKSGVHYWQILPVGATGYGDSPYQSFSSFSGNPYFIDFRILEEEGYLNKDDYGNLDYETGDRIDYGKIYETRKIVLRIAYENFKRLNKEEDELNKFINENCDWIKDYALFMALKEHFGNVSWENFPLEVKNRDKVTLIKYENELKDKIDFEIFKQYKFYNQYFKWKEYVNSIGIEIIGDMPIYVSPDSLEIWMNRELFLEDKVGGCPPDGFSEGGQKWGNPVYNWEEHKKTDFRWWIKRIEKTLELVDVLRIDHFRGFEEYWEIPKYDLDGRNGKWVKAPGDELFNKVKEALGDIRIVAEDLGYTTQSLVEFRERIGYPGMKMLQFAFNPNKESDFIPHQIERNWVVYTGTHDSDTVKSWFEKGNKEEVEFAKKYLHLKEESEYVKGFIRGAWSSVANLAMAQIQDFLELGEEGRMNVPGIADGNWSWRLKKDMLTNDLQNLIYDFNKTYFRLNKRDNLCTYNGKLGYKYNKEYTEFKIYAPKAKKVELILNETEIKNMEKNRKTGVFYTKINGDLESFKYMYKVYFDDIVYTTIDPYANACNANGKSGMIIDLEKTNPENFNRMEKFSNPLDAVIYELHIRDFTLEAKNRGKYLGVIEEKQLNYLKELGITHVQILPFYDYSTESVDEKNPDLKYNWGYDPVNYNIPEGSYATDPENPYVRIKELKEMINILHKNGIRVIMDVVYNHVFDAMAHSLYKTMREYAFRFDKEMNFSNGSGCGNDVASERKMISKYIVDSIKYWAKEYKLDGFRFDLMGILDVDTMNEIRIELDKIDKGIIVLGEGWDLNTELQWDKKANQLNAYKMSGIAFFNDDLRDGLRGSTYEKLGKGFVNGGEKENRLLGALKGGCGLKGYTSPEQVIQYVEAHDNNTVFDHFAITNGDETEEERLKMQAIATSLVLTSQGIAFLHAGQEFFRTKFGVENSYKSPDEINKFDFERAEKYKKYVKYFSELIKFRKENKLLKLNSYDEIEEKFDTILYEKNIICYAISQDILIIANANKDGRAISFDKKYQAEYEIVFGRFAKVENEYTNLANGFEIEGLDFVILMKK